MHKVFLGFGHGGKDPGAVANGFYEKDLNLEVGLACKEELEKYGVQVLASRTKDENDTVQEEVEECNAYNPALAVEIHFDAGNGDGCTLFHTIHKGVGQTLARNIEVALIAFGQNSRGVRTKINAEGEDYYVFIRETLCPAVLVECAFLDNKADVEIADSFAERKEMGRAIAKGILATLGIYATTILSDEALIQRKSGLQPETMEYLKNYVYGKDLIRKLAAAMR